MQWQENLCYSVDSAFCFLPDDPSAAVTASAESFDNCQPSSTNYGPGANDIPFVPPSKKHHLVELYQFAGDYSTKYRKRDFQQKDWRQVQLPASKLRSACRDRRLRFGERPVLKSVCRDRRLRFGERPVSSHQGKDQFPVIRCSIRTFKPIRTRITPPASSAFDL